MGLKANLDLKENKAYHAHRVKMAQKGVKETPGQKALKAYRLFKSQQEKRGNPELKVSNALLDLLDAMELMDEMEQQVKKDLNKRM